MNTNGEVRIADGTYSGDNNINITIDKNMKIIGQSQAGTIIDAQNQSRIFYINSGVTVNISNITIKNGTSTDGGAIYNEGTLNISDSWFDGNKEIHSFGNGGGAIFNNGILIVNNCNFTNNWAMTRGGAIINNGISTIISSTFSSNAAGDEDSYPQFGGAICNMGTLTINDSAFDNNTPGVGLGGAIYNEGNLTVNNSTFTKNYNNYVPFLFGIELGGEGGAIYNKGNLTLTGCTFNHNFGDFGWGGAICNDGGNLTIINSTFFHNSAHFKEGGAIYNSGTLTIMGSSFTHNGADSTSGPHPHFGSGGAIYNTGTLNLTSSTFTSNWVTGFGGALYNSGTLIVTNNTFTNNKAYNPHNSDAGLGGAIYNSGILNVTGNTFVSNIAEDGIGSAIYNIYGDATSRIVKFNRFIENDPTETQIYCVRGTLDATLNWWGSNSSPSGKISTGFWGVVIFDPWIVLTITADPTTIDNQGISQVTADLLHDSDAIYHNPLLGQVPDIPLTLNITWGSFSNSEISHYLTSNTLIGVISATFYASEGALNPLFNPVRLNATADEYTTNDTESAYIYINPVANLTITKTGPTTAIAGTIIYYNITIKNNGPDPAESVLLSETITNSNIFDSGSIQYRYKTNDNDWSSWISFTNPLTLNLGTIINDKNATIEIRGTINASTTSGTIINNTATTNTTTTPGDKTTSIQTIVNTQADLNVTKTGPESAYAGTQITYTITVENNGPSDAQNVVILDSIPVILQNVSHDSFNLGAIPAGKSKTIHINGTIPPNTPIGTTFQNNATATSDTIGTITPSMMVITTVDTLADVDLTKIVDNSRPDVGNTVTFIVTAHNYGPSDATNIQIQDIMPVNFNNITIIPSKGTYDIGTGIWALNLTSGEEATLNLTGIVSAIMAGKNTTNNATKISQTQEDPDTLDTANVTIYVPKSDLYIQITSNKNNPSIGEIFTLTYKLGNYGPDAADNVKVTIVLPKGFHRTKITGDGNWNYDKNTNTITWILNKVEVGDPYLYITGKNKAIGSSSFTAMINSKTYNSNTDGINPLVIRTNSIKNTKINAARTMSMQHTGIPLNYLIMAILMVIGGLVIPKRK